MAKDKQLSAALDKYNFNGTHKAGICGKTGVEYNLYKITEGQIKGMIAKGSPLFEEKKAAPAEKK